MSEILKVAIDLTEALDLDNEELEIVSQILANELISGDLVERVQAARENDLPEHAKSGTLAFIGGVLKAEINRQNIRRALNFLGHRFYGQKLALTYKNGDRQYNIEYRNQEDINRALETIDQLDSLHVRIYHK